MTQNTTNSLPPGHILRVICDLQAQGKITEFAICKAAEDVLGMFFSIDTWSARFNALNFYAKMKDLALVRSKNTEEWLIGSQDRHLAQEFLRTLHSILLSEVLAAHSRMQTQKQGADSDFVLDM